jgi:hypothetical protein
MGLRRARTDATTVCRTFAPAPMAAPILRRPCAVRIHRVIGALHGFTLLPRISRSLGGAYEVINAFLGDTPVAGEHPCPGQST